MGASIPQIPVGLKKLHPDAKIPTYGTVEAAGADLSAVFYPEDYGTEGVPTPGHDAIAIEPGQRRLIKTGLAIELPPGFEGQVRPRSGLALKNGITIVNAPGTVDSDYRGEIGVILLNTSDKTFYVNPGDRIAQLIVAPVFKGVFAYTGGELSTTARGEGGYGSTGTK